MDMCVIDVSQSYQQCVCRSMANREKNLPLGNGQIRTVIHLSIPLRDSLSTVGFNL